MFSFTAASEDSMSRLELELELSCSTVANVKAQTVIAVVTRPIQPQDGNPQ